jgi:hypothetical protein
MSHGAAGSRREPLKMLAIILQHGRNMSRHVGRSKNARNADEQRVCRVAGGLGFEPRLTESESAVLSCVLSEIGGALTPQRDRIAGRRIDLKRGCGQTRHRKTADGRDQRHQALEPIAFSAAA